MTLWPFVAGGVVGLGLVVIVVLRRLQYEVERADFVPRWKSFVEAPLTIDGKEQIQPAKVPPVKPLIARVVRFPQRVRKRA